MLIDAIDFQFIDDVPRDEVFPNLLRNDELAAVGTWGVARFAIVHLFYALIAEGMAIWREGYPQKRRAGCVNTSMHIAHFSRSEMVVGLTNLRVSAGCP